MAITTYGTRIHSKLTSVTCPHPNSSSFHSNSTANNNSPNSNNSLNSNNNPSSTHKYRKSNGLQCNNNKHLNRNSTISRNGTTIRTYGTTNSNSSSSLAISNLCKTRHHSGAITLSCRHSFKEGTIIMPIITREEYKVIKQYSGEAVEQIK